MEKKKKWKGDGWLLWDGESMRVCVSECVINVSACLRCVCVLFLAALLCDCVCVWLHSLSVSQSLIMSRAGSNCEDQPAVTRVSYLLPN